MAGHSGGEGTSGTVGRVGALAFGLKDFLLDSLLGGKAQQINGFVEPSGSIAVAFISFAR